LGVFSASGFDVVYLMLCDMDNGHDTLSDIFYGSLVGHFLAQ
jgi:hypothetical protein